MFQHSTAVRGTQVRKHTPMRGNDLTHLRYSFQQDQRTRLAATAPPSCDYPLFRKCQQLKLFGREAQPMIHADGVCTVEMLEPLRQSFIDGTDRFQISPTQAADSARTMDTINENMSVTLR